jgi:hypothetical protein
MKLFSKEKFFPKEETEAFNRAFTRLADLAGVPDDYFWGQRTIPSDSKRWDFFCDLEVFVECASADYDIYSERGDIDFEHVRSAVRKARDELRKLPEPARKLIATVIGRWTSVNFPSTDSYLGLLEEALAVLTGKETDRRKGAPRNYRFSIVCEALSELPKRHGGKGIPLTGPRFEQALKIFRKLVPSGIIPNVPAETTVKRIKKQFRR